MKKEIIKYLNKPIWGEEIANVIKGINLETTTPLLKIKKLSKTMTLLLHNMRRVQVPFSPTQISNVSDPDWRNPQRNKL